MNAETAKRWQNVERNNQKNIFGFPIDSELTNTTKYVWCPSCRCQCWTGYLEYNKSIICDRCKTTFEIHEFVDWK